MNAAASAIRCAAVSVLAGGVFAGPGTLPALANGASRSGQQRLGDTTIVISYEFGTVNIAADSSQLPVTDPPTYTAAPTHIDGSFRRDCSTPSADKAAATFSFSSRDPRGVLKTADPANTLSSRILSAAGRLETQFGPEDAIRSVTWRCAIGSVDGTPFAFYFDGFEAFTPKIAEQHVRPALEEQYGPEIFERRHWLACPEAQFAVPFGQEGEETAYCRYQIGRRDNVLSGEFSVTATPFQPIVQAPLSQRTYSQRPIGCRSRYERSYTRSRQRISNIDLRSPKPLCNERFIRTDLAAAALWATRHGRRTFNAGLRGTNSVGFEKQAGYRCRLHSSSSAEKARFRVRCVNELGDVITYAFTARPDRPAT